MTQVFHLPSFSLFFILSPPQNISRKKKKNNMRDYFTRNTAGAALQEQDASSVCQWIWPIRSRFCSDRLLLRKGWKKKIQCSSALESEASRGAATSRHLE